jgi:hypothetical protein
MRLRATLLSLLFGSLVSAAIIDRIAIVVNNGIIKDSDIERYIRVTSFLDAAPFSVNSSTRKDAANHLIDQLLIRREISLGGYGSATDQEAEAQLDQLVKQRYRSEQSLDNTLKRYGLDQLQLREQFKWQLTVLRFVDVRFKPAAFVTDEQIQSYYNEHEAALHQQYPGRTAEYLRPDIENILRGEQVNKLFFDWLDDQKKESKIKYLEEGLR